VKVEIVDINDNPPIFVDSHVFYKISEFADLGSGFVIPSATDSDSGRNGIQHYQLSSSNHSTSSSSFSSFAGGRATAHLEKGKVEKFELALRTTADGATDLRLILKQRLDREELEYFTVTVLAIDGGDPPMTGSVYINITVLDANDNNPIFENSSYEVSLIFSRRGVRELIP